MVEPALEALGDDSAERRLLRAATPVAARRVDWPEDGNMAVPWLEIEAPALVAVTCGFFINTFLTQTGEYAGGSFASRIKDRFRAPRRGQAAPDGQIDAIHIKLHAPVAPRRMDAARMLAP